MITIVSIDHHIFDDGTITQWKSDHPDYLIVPGWDSVPDNNEGLFTSPVPLYIIVDKVVADDIKNLEGRQEDILIESSSQPAKKKWGKGVEYINLSKPSRSEMTSTGKRCGLSSSTMKNIYTISDDPSSVGSMIRQMEILDDRDVDMDPIDLFPGNQPPWNITDAVLSGNSRQAVNAVESHLAVSSKKSTSVSLAFQLAGYFKKVAASKDDIAGISSPFFSKASKTLKDTDGLIHDLSYYVDAVMTSKNPDIELKCMVASMSGRFKK